MLCSPFVQLILWKPISTPKQLNDLCNIHIKLVQPIERQSTEEWMCSTRWLPLPHPLQSKIGLWTCVNTTISSFPFIPTLGVGSNCRPLECIWSYPPNVISSPGELGWTSSADTHIWLKRWMEGSSWQY